MQFPRNNNSVSTAKVGDILGVQIPGGELSMYTLRYLSNKEIGGTVE